MIVKPVYNPASMPGMTKKQYSAYHRKKYQEWWRATHPYKRKQPPQQNGETVPAKLSECPNCGCRFYMVKGAL